MTREIKRIEPILEQLRALWLKHPDYTFGQIIKQFCLHPKEYASKEDVDVYLSLCTANHAIPSQLPLFESSDDVHIELDDGKDKLYF